MLYVFTEGGTMDLDDIKVDHLYGEVLEEQVWQQVRRDRRARRAEIVRNGIDGLSGEEEHLAIKSIMKEEGL